MSFKDLNLKIKYRSGKDNILGDFYLPILQKAKYYNRAVGYFSSSILIEYISSLETMVMNNGKIKLLISPFVSERDYIALQESKDLDFFVNSKVDLMFESFLKHNHQSLTSAKLLKTLIELKILEIKIAVPKNENGIFHDKVGIFKSFENEFVTILGSNNETKSAALFNHESFAVFKSWIHGQEEYCKLNIDDFEEYWTKKNNNLVIYDLKSALSEDIFKRFETNETIEELYGKLRDNKTKTTSNYKLNFKPYDYQKKAVEDWLEVEKGILKFATGSGKTKTAIYLMHKLKLKYGKNFFVIVVPDKTLVYQWSKELEELNQNVLRCFSDNSSWYNELYEKIDIYQYSKLDNEYVVVSVDTFFSEKFSHLLKKLNEDYMLIVDECHTIGTEKRLNAMPKSKKKLGLSATPELFFSQENTTKLLNYFGGILAEYSLKEAISDGKLVGYEYYPIIVHLDEEEKEEYKDITRKIVKLLGFDEDTPSDRTKNDVAQKLLFNRARIVYGARNKLSKLQNLLATIEKRDNLLIYCGATSYSDSFVDEVEQDSQTQLEKVNSILKENDIVSVQYTQSESGNERERAIQLFKDKTVKTLVAIKCLDEGVNIPEIERAIILSSSTNPREFIQRRGRLLRKNRNKKKSVIYDMVVLEDEIGFEGMNKKELERVFEFSSIAINNKKLKIEFENLFNKYEIKKEKEI